MDGISFIYSRKKWDRVKDCLAAGTSFQNIAHSKEKCLALNVLWDAVPSEWCYNTLFDSGTSVAVMVSVSLNTGLVEGSYGLFSKSSGKSFSYATGNKEL